MLFCPDLKTMLQNLVIGREDYMRRCGDREDNQEIEYACMIKCFIVCLGRKIRMVYYVSWRRRWYRTPVLLPGKSHGQRSLVGCSPWGREELDTTEQLPSHFSLSCIGEGNGNPLQCSCLENPRNGGAWWADIYGVAQIWT